MRFPFIVGVSQRIVENDSYSERRDCLSHDWYKLFARTLPEVVFFPLPNHPARIAEILLKVPIKGVILTGGNDWGEAKDRDQTELKIVQHCLTKGLPLLGVCRGLQVINKCLGGEIVCDLGVLSNEPHVDVFHSIRIVDPHFVRLNDDKSELTVNSFHNQGVRLEGLGIGCEPFAWTKDGVVEGIFCRDKKIVGVQWHPERENNAASSFDEKLIRDVFHLGQLGEEE